MNGKYYGQHTKGCNCSDCAFEDSLPTDRTEVEIKRRIAEAVEAAKSEEREACAKIADQELMRRGASYEESLSAREIAAAIRARGSQNKEPAK